MDELKKEKNRLALEKIELLDKINSYQNREDLSRDDKQDALEELNDRLNELEDKLTKTRHAYNAAVSQEKYKTDTIKYEQARSRRESVQKYEENKAKYKQVRDDRKAREDLLIKFISQNESARNEFMRGKSSQEIRERHAGEIEAFEKSLNAPAHDANQPQEVVPEAANENTEKERFTTPEEAQEFMMRMGKEIYGSELKDESQQIINGQVSDEEALNMMANAGKIQNSDVEFELEQPNGNNKSEENAKAIENDQVSDEEALNMMADAGKNQSSEVAVEVESENESKQTTTGGVKMSVTGGRIHETVSRIKEALDGKDSALLGKIKITAGLAVAALVAIPVVAPIVSSVGTVAAAGLAIDGYYNFNKGRNGLKK